MLTLFGALWNLVLLAIPCSISFFLEKKFPHKKWKALSIFERIFFILLLGVFVAFFPNIPYIFTDVRHVLDHCSSADYYKRCSEATWVVPVLFTYSVFAIPFFVISLEKFAKILGEIIAPMLRNITPVILIFLSALGVCLGLFERLNSWDLLVNLSGAFQSGLSYFESFEKFGTVMTFFASFLAIFYFFRYFFVAGKK